VQGHVHLRRRRDHPCPRCRVATMLMRQEGWCVKDHM
jgi:hypothetical protein